MDDLPTAGLSQKTQFTIENSEIMQSKNSPNPFDNIRISEAGFI